MYFCKCLLQHQTDFSSTFNHWPKIFTAKRTHYAHHLKEAVEKHWSISVYCKLKLYKCHVINYKPHKHSWIKHLSPFPRAIVNHSGLLHQDPFFPTSLVLVIFQLYLCMRSCCISCYQIMRMNSLKKQSFGAAHWLSEITQYRAGSIPVWHVLVASIQLRAEKEVTAQKYVFWILKRNRHETEPFKLYQ